MDRLKTIKTCNKKANWLSIMKYNGNIDTVTSNQNVPEFDATVGVSF